MTSRHYLPSDRDSIAAVMRLADNFTVSQQGTDVYLDCPIPECSPSTDSLSDMTIWELRDRAETHLVSEHLPALQPGMHRCDGCYLPIPTGRGFGRYCGECAQ